MKIVIVGGVAAGASTAARARRLNEQAEIILLEKGKHVSFANCGLPYHLGGVIPDREDLLLQTPQSLKASLNLDVRVGHEVLSIDPVQQCIEIQEVESKRAYRETYDQLVLCPGATPIRPALPGINHPKIFVLRNIEDMDQIKAALDAGAKSAVVIGGGYIGVEMAENLRMRKLEVDLVEMLDQVMPPLDREMARDLENHMRWHGVRLHLGTAAAAFRDENGKVLVELQNSEHLSADLVILSVGVRPDTTLTKTCGLQIGPRGGIQVNEFMETSRPHIYAAGDAVEVIDTVTGQPAIIPLAGPANRQGRIVADNLMGVKSRYTSTQGTAIVKIFDMTGGGTGASEKSLKKAGIPFRKIYIHPSGHAGYYPQTTPMHLKLLCTPDTGKLLGAQITGYDGVDKRLDVLATALRAGLTVYDLKDLELAYAPPYGSAKDPVNMAGFVAENLLQDRIRFWYAEDYPAQTNGGVILDVRGPQEFQTWHIPGALNIPLGKLRTQLDQLPKDKPIFVYCKVGFRSYLAYRILTQNGFERVTTLAGGSMTFCSHHSLPVCSGKPERPLLSYAEEQMSKPAPPPLPAAIAGKVITLDCTRMQCPGPIKKLSETASALAPGDEILVTASDPGFAADGPACCRQNGWEVVALTQNKGQIELRVRKSKGGLSAPASASTGESNRPAKLSLIVFSGDLDKVMAAFVIANGALAMGQAVTIFFTFWGLNALRKGKIQPEGKPFMDCLFGWMMPNGARKLKLSKMNMMGMGTLMMNHVMRQKNVIPLPDLIQMAHSGGARMVACTMSMDVMGLTREELIDGLEFGGVATFLEEAQQSGTALFI